MEETEKKEKKTLKEKVKETGTKVKEKAKKVGKTFCEVCTEQPALVFTAATTVGGILLGVLTGTAAMNAEREQKCSVQDDLTGCEYKATHPLTNSEILELSDRLQQGESKGQALRNMGVLRKEKKRK